MNIQRAAPVNELLAKLIFLILPTIIGAYVLLTYANEYYSILNNQAYQQTIYLAAGMIGAAIFYIFRFRFLISFLLLSFILYSIYKGLDHLATSEFDAFFISVRFWVFATLFTGGWLIGWGFSRLRYFSVFFSTAVLCICILLLAKQQVDSYYNFVRGFVPPMLYTVYIIFTAEQIYSYKDKSQKFWWFLTRRLVAFSVLALLLLGAVLYRGQKEIKETVANYGGGGKTGQNSMLKKNKDNTFDLNDYARLSSSLGRTNELLFCAHIDNYFPNTAVPNPLYLTAFYFTKFDTLTETFERDSTIPYNDLFNPDPSKLPLFFTKTDTSVIKNSLSDKFRKIVDVEIYSKTLSPSVYLAPNVGFFVQPVTVDKDFRQEFKSAFRAKSYVSELNSAYFVYNAQSNPQIKKFQQQRFEVLRTASDYSKVDPGFMKYYTFMPSDVKFKAISDLAHKVTANAITPVDKVIAIRDYFLSKDENGDPLYKYTDNPGVPDIPSASKLSYFLFENHKGYCAYYAGATLFMLRALGIPSRIAVGFLTVDRSDKNKGWYWYYEDQAHAWVQVYFPGFGWMDFDTTVGNSDAQESPKPDGTPPSQPPKAWLAADGTIIELDTTRKMMTLKVGHYVFHDKEYTLDNPVSVSVDLKVATMRRDSVEVPLSDVHTGEKATAVSYAEAFKKMEAGTNEKAASLIKRFPTPAPIDEIYLKRKEVQQKEEKPLAAPKEKHLPVRQIAWAAVGIITGFILLCFLMPSLIFIYYKSRYKNANGSSKQAYWGYRAASFYLHQVGMFRGRLTPMQYARDIVDPALNTSLTSFMNVYLKNKYAKQSLTPAEEQLVAGFLLPFLKSARENIKLKKRLSGFLNPLRTVSFFVVPEDEKEM